MEEDSSRATRTPATGAEAAGPGGEGGQGAVGVVSTLSAEAGAQGSPAGAPLEPQPQSDLVPATAPEPRMPPSPAAVPPAAADAAAETCAATAPEPRPAPSPAAVPPAAAEADGATFEVIVTARDTPPESGTDEDLQDKLRGLIAESAETRARPRQQTLAFMVSHGVFNAPAGECVLITAVRSLGLDLYHSSVLSQFLNSAPETIVAFTRALDTAQENLYLLAKMLIAALRSQFPTKPELMSILKKIEGDMETVRDFQKTFGSVNDSVEWTARIMDDLENGVFFAVVRVLVFLYDLGLRHTALVLSCTRDSVRNEFLETLDLINDAGVELGHVRAKLTLAVKKRGADEPGGPDDEASILEHVNFLGQSTARAMITMAHIRRRFGVTPLSDTDWGDAVEQLLDDLPEQPALSMKAWGSEAEEEGEGEAEESKEEGEAEEEGEGEAEEEGKEKEDDGEAEEVE